MILLYALFPLILLILLMIVFKKSATFSIPTSWFFAYLIGVFIWKIDFNVLLGAFIKGSLVAFEIVFIVFGALVLLDSLVRTKLMKSLHDTLGSISKDKRVLAIIIGWSFVVFIEGAAGFGTPAALAAPLLVSLGLTPLNAVVVSLISDSIPVSFGAIGTPLFIGIAPTIANPATLTLITKYTALIHSIIGIFIPLLVSCLTAKMSMKKKFKDGLKIWKFALFSGFSFVVPYFLLAYYLGPEFPSFLGGLIGLLIVIIAAKNRFLLKDLKEKKSKHFKFKISSFTPYIIAGTLLVLTRLGFIKKYLAKIAIGFTKIFGTEISYSFKILLSPGILFLVASFLTIIIFKKPIKLFGESVKKTFPSAMKVFIVLIFATSLVQMYLFSGINQTGLDSMPQVVAEGLGNVSGPFYPFVAPFIGLLGSFITGSNTVSNLLFTPFQEQSALALGFPVFLIIALQNIGGAIGNMIAPHNVIAASATVKLRHQEGKIIRHTIGPALIYATLAGIIAMILVYTGFMPF